jgi:acyl carrier protein
MGLDAVELVMEVEETFGFSMPDGDIVTLDTVGKLYDYIVAHRFDGRQQGCLASVAFYKVRRALMSVCGMARGDIRLSVDLAAIIPTRRRQQWSALQKAMELRLPELVRPVWATATATAVSCALAISAAVFLIARVGISGAAWGTLCTWCIILYVSYQGTKPLAVVFPSECATVGSLTKSILGRNYGAIFDECQRTNAEEAWNTLRSLIVEQLGVRPDDVTKEASFVKDLRVD